MLFGVTNDWRLLPEFRLAECGQARPPNARYANQRFDFLERQGRNRFEKRPNVLTHRLFRRPAVEFLRATIPVQYATVPIAKENRVMRLVKKEGLLRAFSTSA